MDIDKVINGAVFTSAANEVVMVRDNETHMAVSTPDVR